MSGRKNKCTPKHLKGRDYPLDTRMANSNTCSSLINVSEYSDSSGDSLQTRASTKCQTKCPTKCTANSRDPCKNRCTCPKCTFSVECALKEADLEISRTALKRIMEKRADREKCREMICKSKKKRKSCKSRTKLRSTKSTKNKRKLKAVERNSASCILPDNTICTLPNGKMCRIVNGQLTVIPIDKPSHTPEYKHYTPNDTCMSKNNTYAGYSGNSTSYHPPPPPPPPTTPFTMPTTKSSQTYIGETKYCHQNKYNKSKNIGDGFANNSSCLNKKVFKAPCRKKAYSKPKFSCPVNVPIVENDFMVNCSSICNNRKLKSQKIQFPKCKSNKSVCLKKCSFKKKIKSSKISPSITASKANISQCLVSTKPNLCLKMRNKSKCSIKKATENCKIIKKDPVKKVRKKTTNSTKNNPNKCKIGKCFKSNKNKRKVCSNNTVNKVRCKRKQRKCSNIVRKTSTCKSKRSLKISCKRKMSNCKKSNVPIKKSCKKPQRRRSCRLTKMKTSALKKSRSRSCSTKRSSCSRKSKTYRKSAKCRPCKGNEFKGLLTNVQRGLKCANRALSDIDKSKITEHQVCKRRMANRRSANSICTQESMSSLMRNSPRKSLSGSYTEVEIERCDQEVLPCGLDAITDTDSTLALKNQSRTQCMKNNRLDDIAESLHNESLLLKENANEPIKNQSMLNRLYSKFGGNIEPTL